MKKRIVSALIATMCMTGGMNLVSVSAEMIVGHSMGVEEHEMIVGH